jgi:hypothetical protein
VVAAFLARELEAAAREGPTSEGLASQVWAMGLLFDLVAAAAAEVVSADGFEGRLADHPCFGAVLPCKPLTCWGGCDSLPPPAS